MVPGNATERDEAGERHLKDQTHPAEQLGVLLDVCDESEGVVYGQIESHTSLLGMVIDYRKQELMSSSGDVVC